MTAETDKSESVDVALTTVEEMWEVDGSAKCFGAKLPDSDVDVRRLLGSRPMSCVMLCLSDNTRFNWLTVCANTDGIKAKQNYPGAKMMSHFTNETAGKDTYWQIYIHIILTAQKCFPICKLFALQIKFRIFRFWTFLKFFNTMYFTLAKRGIIYDYFLH